MTLEPKLVERLLVELFIEQMKQAPKQIILDMDVTDDQTHGDQEEAFFNGYYDHTCYAPLFDFLGTTLAMVSTAGLECRPGGRCVECAATDHCPDQRALA